MMNVAIQVQREVDGVVMDDVGQLSCMAPNEITLGRNSTCDVRLDSEEVSRHHARISLGHEGYVIEDSSNNGTRTHQGYVLYRRQGAFPYGTHFTIGPFRVTVGHPGQSTPPQGMPQAYHRPTLASSRAPVAPTTAMPPIPRPPAMPSIHTPSSGEYPVGMVPSRTPSSPVQAPTAMYPAMTGMNPAMTGMNPAMTGMSPALPHGTPAQTRAVPAVDARTPQEVARARANELKNSEELVSLRRKVHGELLKNLDFAKIDPTKADPSLRPRVLTALKRIVLAQNAPILEQLDKEMFISELLDEALGLGPLEPLLADASVTEIMVVDPATIYVERHGKIEITTTRFTDEERVRAVIERIVTPLGRRIDESQPLVDARLADGSRVNAIIRPLALRGSCITIRRFPKRRLTVDDFVRLGSLTPRIAKFLERAVIAKKNILISGGTGSGKTTLLNVLSSSIPSTERIVTIEDAAELQLHQPHVVSLETKHANMEGKGAFTIRDLVKNSLRMRPDRIVVGECRGGEALDMLQAMNTGHDGSITTIHANSPVEALARLETLVLMAGVDLPSQAIREQIARSIHVIVQQTRFTDGSRKITHVSEIDELDPSGRFEVREIFEFEQTGIDHEGRVQGQFEPTGFLPSFTDELLARGLVKPGESLV
ncbi:MAG: Flp pilus assembly complex ATPase component TadA [Deltaproteobacteria bacterium]|nr:Flp pilus assembly complex ATPase component TadA [Deltaproteobacteria bacterium]